MVSDGGSWLIYVGAGMEVSEPCQSLLLTMGTGIEYCGGIGTGNIVKIISNMIVEITACVLYEAMVPG